MKRHRALVSLSHDHHHALVQARRLRQAADGPEPEAAADDFLRFFAAESVRHFREEEELLFPLVVDLPEAREPLVRTLIEHQRLHALVAELEVRLARGEGVGDLMREVGRLQEAHIRHEEREFFPLIERLLGDTGLAALRLPEAGPGATGGGPVWGTESEYLNATLLHWRAGTGPPEHVNEERDVLVAVVEGSATVVVEDERRRLDPGEAIIIEKGRARAISAGPDGVRYLSVHRRRPRLQISSAVPPAPADEA
jgi:quercetin dioxygenase-like cupin family protein/hemerythrin-like domain-containing protein